MIFLIILLLIANIISFLFIFNLYKQIQLLKNNNKTQLMKITKQFVEEVKMENERLERYLSDRDETVANHIYPPLSSKKLQPTKEDEEEIPIEIRPSPSKGKDKVTTSLQGKVLQLYDKGKTAEDIAQQLNCGVTEVSLIIKFHENN